MLICLDVSWRRQFTPPLLPHHLDAPLPPLRVPPRDSLNVPERWERVGLQLHAVLLGAGGAQVLSPRGKLPADAGTYYTTYSRYYIRTK